MDAEALDLIAELINEKEEKIWDWDMAGHSTCISTNGLDFDHDAPCTHQTCHAIPEGETEETCPYEGCELNDCETEVCDDFRSQLRAIRSIREELLGWQARE
jgi:hypothetical protein